MPMIKIALGFASLLALSAVLMGQRMMTAPGMMRDSARHRVAMMYGIPAPYGALRNPLPPGRAAVERGAAVYRENCAACHGPNGAGDGVAGRNLSPAPADLTKLVRMPTVGSDPYLYWTIADGGAPVGSAMPAYKQVLSKRDIWSVIAYLHARLLP